MGERHTFSQLGFYSDGQFHAAYGCASGTKISWVAVKEMAQSYATEFGERVSAGYEKTVKKTIDCTEGDTFIPMITSSLRNLLL